MNRVNYRVLAFSLASMAAVASAATPQEFSLLVDEVYGRPVSLISASKYTLSSFDSVKPIGLGLRYGIEPWSFKMRSLPASAGIDFTYHVKVQDRMTSSGADAGSYRYQYWAIGAHASATCLADFVAGLDLRSEKVNLDAVSGAGGHTMFLRPWARASIGHTFNAGHPKIFVRLEGAVPLVVKNNGDLDNGNDVRKALAPNYQVGLNAGMRF